MGNAGLIVIKRRIKSVENTRKITKAMGLVSTSKFKKARKALLIDEENLELNRTLFSKVVETMDEEDRSAYFGYGINSSKKLYIIVTSDMGLCGGFNANVANFIKENISEDKENIKMIVLGSKGTSYIKKIGFTDLVGLIELSDLPTIKEVRNVYQRAKQLYLNNEVSEVNIVYTEFVSPMKQEVRIDKLLPLEREVVVKNDIEIEPNKEYVLDVALEGYLRSRIRRNLLHSKVSEQSARRAAMDNATTNANDILKALNLKFNRIRQGMITQEISEIVGGAEAQK